MRRMTWTLMIAALLAAPFAYAGIEGHDNETTIAKPMTAETRATSLAAEHAASPSAVTDALYVAEAPAPTNALSGDYAAPVESQ
jgi:hypothetical protein